MGENRRDHRYAARILARMVRRGESLELLTNDVSFRGAFLRTDSPPALRQLVKVTFTLPNGDVVGGHAMVVHVVSPGDETEEVPGVGLQFWGPMDQGKSWEKFIYDLKTREKAGVPSARTSDKVRRQSERVRLQLSVELDGHTTTTRDVSESGMAIRTDSEMPLGVRARVAIKAGEESIDVEVIVRRQIAEARFKGLGVEFLDLNDESRAALMIFLRKHAPTEDALFVAPGDPKLH